MTQTRSYREPILRALEGSLGSFLPDLIGENSGAFVWGGESVVGTYILARRSGYGAHGFP